MNARPYYQIQTRPETNREISGRLVNALFTSCCNVSIRAGQDTRNRRRFQRGVRADRNTYVRPCSQSVSTDNRFSRSRARAPLLSKKKKNRARQFRAGMHLSFVRVTNSLFFCPWSFVRTSVPGTENQAYRSAEQWKGGLDPRKESTAVKRALGWNRCAANLARKQPRWRATHICETQEAQGNGSGCKNFEP